MQVFQGRFIKIACDKVSIAFRERVFLASMLMLCPLGKDVAGTQLSEQKKNTSCQFDVQTRMTTSKHELPIFLVPLSTLNPMYN